MPCRHTEPFAVAALPVHCVRPSAASAEDTHHASTSISRRRSASSSATASTSRPRARRRARCSTNLDTQFPGFRSLCSAASDAVPAHINIYVNNRRSRPRRHATQLNDGDEVAVIPAHGRRRRRRAAAQRIGPHAGAGEPLLAPHHHAPGRAAPVSARSSNRAC